MKTLEITAITDRRGPRRRANTKSNMDQGWLCPKCGKVLAPWREECDHMAPFSVKPLPGSSDPTPLHPWDTGNDPRRGNTWSDSATWHPGLRFVGVLG